MISFSEAMASEALFCSRSMTPIEQTTYFALRSRIDWSGIKVESQRKIGRYTVDFLVTKFEGDQVIVECDGHDFHERTKEQAQHDKRRDRELQALGFKVYRFTGSEIWKSGGRCVLESLGLI